MRPVVYFCLGALFAGEAYVYSQPSDPVCEWRRSPPPDFGRPAGCGGGPGDHTRGTTITALSTGANTSIVVHTSYIVWDSDSVQLDHFPPEFSLVLGSTSS